MPNLPPEAMLSDLMSVALNEAEAALAHDDVPVGAVVARIADGAVVASAHNEKELRGDPTAHAEVLALQAASHVIGGWRLGGHALVSTIEPCPMCAGAALAARVDLIVFGAADPRAGAAGSLYNLAADPRLNHEIPVVPGVHAEACAALVERFFSARRP
jgi:tRNA(adenine34) deaminase